MEKWKNILFNKKDFGKQLEMKLNGHKLLNICVQFYSNAGKMQPICLSSDFRNAELESSHP